MENSTLHYEILCVLSWVRFCLPSTTCIRGRSCIYNTSSFKFQSFTEHSCTAISVRRGMVFSMPPLLWWSFSFVPNLVAWYYHCSPLQEFFLILIFRVPCLHTRKKDRTRRGNFFPSIGVDIICKLCRPWTSVSFHFFLLTRYKLSLGRDGLQHSSSRCALYKFANFLSIGILKNNCNDLPTSDSSSADPHFNLHLAGFTHIE